MKIAKNRNTQVLITTILIISMAFPLTTLQTQAAATSDKATYAVIGAMPNPVGIGQTVLIALGITDPVTTGTGFTGVTVIITHPDNTTETIGPYRTDSTGGTGITYTPTMVGTYYLKTHFPGQWFNITATIQHLLQRKLQPRTKLLSYKKTQFPTTQAHLYQPNTGHAP